MSENAAATGNFLDDWDSKPLNCSACYCKVLRLRHGMVTGLADVASNQQQQQQQQQQEEQGCRPHSRKTHADQNLAQQRSTEWHRMTNPGFLVRLCGYHFRRCQSFSHTCHPWSISAIHCGVLVAYIIVPSNHVLCNWERILKHWLTEQIIYHWGYFINQTLRLRNFKADMWHV